MKKLHFVLIALILLGAQLSYGQLEAANWYFGYNAGIRFDPGTGAVTPMTDGRISTDEGCATISDSDGNLLFYTDGILVFNRNHDLMPRGFGLRGNPSSTQSAIIIPKPQDPDTYYIFTVDVRGQNNDRGLNLYEVDMTADGGLGDVTNSTKPINLLPTSSEKITAINHATRDEILVVAYANGDGLSIPYNTFYTFTVDASGVNPTPVASTQNSVARDPRGNIKVSADGKYLVSCNYSDPSFIYDFDQNTGVVSNERFLVLPFPNFAGYGAEFSPSGNLLYITATNNFNGPNPFSHSSALYQFDLEATDIGNSGIVIDPSRQGFRGALQLGIDGKIYRALSASFNQGTGFLGRINDPDVRGTGANYVHDAIQLPGNTMSSQGLPPFIQSFFTNIQVENVCLGDQTLFTFSSNNPPDSVLWDFGDGTTSSLENPTYQYPSAGSYTVTLTLDFGGATRISTKQIVIFDTPVANPAADAFICDENLDGMEVFDLSVTTAEILGTQDPNDFTVAYFRSQNDADLSRNPISLPYTSNVPQQRLFARVNNNDNRTCYDTTSFLINIYDQPVANEVQDLEQCDDNFDGVETFILSDQNTGILQNQDPTKFTITYHLSASDAVNDTAPLPNSYRNTRPFRQTIYARVENNAETACEAVTEFDLVVQVLPEAIDFDAFQCDEDGVPDRRTNFNLSSFDAAIANGASNVEVSYYINQNNADNDVQRLDNRDYRNLTPQQTIFARVTNTTTGCFNTATVTLSVSASDAQDAILITCDDDGVEDGFYLFTLDDADSSVLVTAPSNVTVVYYATNDDALLERNPLPNQFTNTVPGAQTIYARAESPDGNCYGISEVQLVVNELPQVQPTGFEEYCGNDPQPLRLEAGPLPGNTTDYTYNWSTGETTHFIEVRNGGEYSVTVTNANGCSSERVITVVISGPANINRIDVVNGNGGSFGSATADVSGLGDYEFRIDPNASFQDSPVFNNLEPGFYDLTVNDKNGCGETKARFGIVGYPQFFTPNGDGFNDFWQLDGVGGMFETDAIIYIFDRYGKLLKQLSPSSQGWDGTFNGEPLPSSDYWFKATLTDGTEFSSHFTLKR